MVSIQKEALGRLFQSLFIRLRVMAKNEAGHQAIADLCDGAEYLASLVYREEDKTETFGDYLRSMADRHHCNEAVRIFESRLDQ